MIHYDILRQERYSRGELLLRTFFGWLYIGIPHMFLLLFIGIAVWFLMIVAWFAVLFTGRYPLNLFEFQLNALRWNARVEARLIHLLDGYPAFGMEHTEPGIILDIPYPERLSRGLLLLRTFFGWFYILIPHGFLLFFRGLATIVLVILAWWVVLFTGNYPAKWFAFIVGTLRWNYRVSAYTIFLSDTYPPFHGRS
jgi:hypothetical protein